MLSYLAHLLDHAGLDREAEEAREEARRLYLAPSPERPPAPDLSLGVLDAFFASGLCSAHASLMEWHRFFQEPPDDPALGVREGFALRSYFHILEASYGQVKLPYAYSWETRLPVPKGLLCAKIFGPLQDFACLCGKYRLLQEQGIVCERCGVEVISSLVRLSRLGHIELAAPVAHPWCYRGNPSWLALLLGITQRELEEVLAEQSFLVPIHSDRYGYTKISHFVVSPRPPDDAWEFYKGAAGLKDLLSTLDLYRFAEDLRWDIQDLRPRQKSPTGRIARQIAREEARLAFLDALAETNKEAEWMLLDLLPVLPPDGLAPLSREGVPCDRDAIQGSYLRILSINRLLEELIDSGMDRRALSPFVRELQRAVDALFDCFGGAAPE